MGRVNVTDTDGNLVGWFAWDKAASWSDRDYNGNGSGGTGRGQSIFRTAGGKWVLCHWTAWQGERNTYEYTTPRFAKSWLLRNDEDAAVESYFGEQPEEEDLRGPGRPEIGGRVTTAIGDDLLASVDAYAGECGIARAEALRRLVSAGLAVATGR